MAWDDKEDTTLYQAVVNHGQQYSIWPDYKEMPGDWPTAGKNSNKQNCLT
jgi:MbtH protein